MFFWDMNSFEFAPTYLCLTLTGGAKYARENKAEGSNSFLKGEAVKHYLLLIVNMF